MEFSSGTILLAGKEIPLCGHPRKPAFRRIYVQENVSIPPRSQVNVPVRLAWTAYERGVNNTEWVLDPKQVCHGIVVAWSLLPRVESKTFVRAINLSDEPRTLSAESCMVSAWPAEVVGCGSPATETHQAAPPCDPAFRTRHPGSDDTRHVLPVVDSFANDLPQHQFAAAKQLVCDYADIFSQLDFDLGHCDILPHRIDTGNARPFKEQLRRHPIAHLEFIDEQVEHML